MDNYLYFIVALLPLAALMLLLQVDPYHALVIRAILGAVAALVYAVLGAADVALTEALVGTLLAVTLYVVAVRSSLVMRLGILEGMEAERQSDFPELIASLRKIINQHHLRLEIVEYPHAKALEQALMSKEVHGICTPPEPSAPETDRLVRLKIRVRRLAEIMQTELTSPGTIPTNLTISKVEDKD